MGTEMTEGELLGYGMCRERHLGWSCNTDMGFKSISVCTALTTTVPVTMLHTMRTATQWSPGMAVPHSVLGRRLPPLRLTHPPCATPHALALFPPLLLLQLLLPAASWASPTLSSAPPTSSQPLPPSMARGVLQHECRMSEEWGSPGPRAIVVVTSHHGIVSRVQWVQLGRWSCR